MFSAAKMASRSLARLTRTDWPLISERHVARNYELSIKTPERAMQLPTFSNQQLLLFFVELPFVVMGFGCLVVAGLICKLTVAEWYAHKLPQDLKTFSQMKWAFHIGGKEDTCRRSAIHAMRNFAVKGADPSQLEMIAAMMRNAITKELKKSDNLAANRVYQMLETLAAAAPAWEADFLARVARSKLEGWARGAAIQRLAQLRGPDSLEFILMLADDPLVAKEAAEAIGSLGPVAATPAAISRLQRMLGETQNHWAPAAAARALIALNHANDPNLSDMDKFDPWTRFALRVKVAGLDAAALVEQLFAAGVIGEDRRQSIKPSKIVEMQKALDVGAGFEAVESFLEHVRSVYPFDTEWNPEPEYNVLLAELSQISSPRLPIAEIVVQQGGEVRCKVAGRPARFNPVYRGDWTDLEAVLSGLNDALAAAGLPERFANLTSGGQDAYVIVGAADGLANLVETLGLPLDEDANVTIAAGIAAEDVAVEQIKAEHPGVMIIRD